MDNLKMNMVSSHLAANISDQGTIVFCENTVMIPTDSSVLKSHSVAAFMRPNGEITFMYLDPQFNYLPGPYVFDESCLEPAFECYADDCNMVVTITWIKGEQKYGFLGCVPRSADNFPAAGYLALEELKNRVTDIHAYKKAEDALFEAIGRLIYPNEQKAIKLTRRLYREDLHKHHQAGTFPLKGTSVQSGVRCMINGELHVLTRYGIAKVSYGAYGKLVMDASFSIRFSEGSCSIEMRVFCNSETPICEDFQGASTSPSSSGCFSIYSFPEIFQTLSSYYKDSKLVKNIFTAVLSEACFHHTDLSLQSRWLNASEIIETVLDNQLDPVADNEETTNPTIADHMCESALSGICDHHPIPLIGIKNELRFTEHDCKSDSPLKKWIDGVKS